MATALQSRSSEVFAVDIHPAAQIGRGVLLDHGTGLVIGETAVVGNNVSILHNVTLGGTGKEHGDRHPKISDNVLIGASATILGSIQVGKGAQVAAGSLVLKPVPPRTMVAGSPAREIGRISGNPAESMEQWRREDAAVKLGVEAWEVETKPSTSKSAGVEGKKSPEAQMKDVAAGGYVQTKDGSIHAANYKETQRSKSPNKEIPKKDEDPMGTYIEYMI